MKKARAPGSLQNKVRAKLSIPGCWGSSQRKERHPGKVCCLGRRSSWGQRSVESFDSGQVCWAEVPHQVVRASKSPDALNVRAYLARDQAASQHGLNRIHWVGCRKEWTLVTTRMCLRAEQDLEDRSCHLQGPTLEPRDCDVMITSDIWGMLGDFSAPLYTLSPLILLFLSELWSR